MMHYRPLVESRMAKASPEERSFYEALAAKKSLMAALAFFFIFTTFALPWDTFAQSVSTDVLRPLWWASAIAAGITSFYRLMLGCLASYPGEY